LGVIDEPSGNGGWCAGYDAENIYEAWQSLAGGSAVDERQQELKAVQQPAARNASVEATVSDGGFLGAEEAPGLHGGHSAAPAEMISMGDDDFYDDFCM